MATDTTMGNDTTLAPTNVGSHLSKRAELTPGLEAVVDDAVGRRFTYAELNQRADQVANALLELGLQPGDRVATLLPNCHQFVEIFYGAARAGLVVVALNWRLVADELAYILDNAGATVMISGPDYDAVVEDLANRTGDDATPIENWFRIEGGAAWSDWDLEVGSAPTTPVAPVGGGDDPMFIMYTSGTTGLPKGVLHTHNSVEWSILTVLATADLRFGDRYLICLPLFHVGALNPLLDTIYKGGTAILMRTFDPVKIWEVFRDENIDCTLAVPAMLQFMLQTYDPQAHQPLRLRWIMSGASPVPASLIEDYAGLGLEVHQVYGLTESGGPACLISPDAAMAHIGSTGKAFFHTDVRIVDPEGNDVGVDEPGEVIVRGRHIMAGYWNNQEATDEVVIDGWLHTGDVAVYDAEGFVFIMDRIKDMIISGGENVYPAEIEDVIRTHPAVADVAVIGIPSDRWGETPLAVVVKADDALDAETVLGYCGQKLARYKLPHRVEFVDEIPRNPTGKALKKDLRVSFADVTAD
ncbi:MAG: acyl-CoA synthetase [Acidimicrobiales bacterium]